MLQINSGTRRTLMDRTRPGTLRNWRNKVKWLLKSVKQKHQPNLMQVRTG